MQRAHSTRHLLWRGGVAALSGAMMVSGLYPWLPHVWRRSRRHALGPQPLRSGLVEWCTSAALSLVRPSGFLGLPGATVRGPRPIILVHGYAMNRANFLPLAWRLARAGLGPIFGFEYWSLGRVAASARQLGWFVDQVRAALGAPAVDIVGHSMGGVVGRYYVAFAGGDGVVTNLITLGSPHAGTELSAIGVGHPTRELVLGSKLTARLAAAGPPRTTKLTVVWSHGDALVPAAHQPAIAAADTIVYDDLGHVALLGSRRVARDVIARLAGLTQTGSPSSRAGS